jgi:LuxR family maltose regulon positive regulatory protein
MFTGDIVPARQALFQALEISQKAGNPMTTVLVRCQIADLDSLQGRLHKAYDFYQETLQLAVDRYGQPLPVAGMACLGLGEVQREWNNLSAAEEFLRRGLELCRRWGVFTAFDGYISLARVRQAQGDPAAARIAINQAVDIARQFDLSDLDDRMVECHAARLLISQGDLEAARRWLEKSDLDSSASPQDIAHSQGEQGETQPLSKTFPMYYLREIECSTAARLFLAQNRPSDALSVLHGLLEPAEKGLRMRSVVEILILHSLAYDQLSDQPQALRCLSRAVALAQPEGYIRLFADEGTPLAALLLRVKQQSSPEVAPYLNRLLAAFPGTPPTYTPIPSRSTPTADQPVEPLSSRELEVLQYLAAGLSNDEIANRLTVALSTVKTHVHNILNKLGAASRLAAVQRAREIGLLERG